MCHKKIVRKRPSENPADEPPKKRISPSGNVLPVQLPPGEILIDLTGKHWKVGKTIGYGGFGEIYVASDNVIDPVQDDAPYVIKVENHTNGPLFVEVNCFLRIGRREMLEEWKKSHNLKSFGMPHYIASGSRVFNKEKLRFLVIPRYDESLENIFVSKEKKLNLKTVALISSQIVTTLEYIHSKGYVHCDVKASNILHSTTKRKAPEPIRYQCNPVKNLRPKIAINYAKLSPYFTIIKQKRRPFKTRHDFNLRKMEPVNYFEDEEVVSDEKVAEVSAVEEDTNEMVLIDYGLASKYRLSNGQHKEFCIDPRKAHFGTVLFCSLDAHSGASSRRSDLESLGYNMIYWLTSNLPWSADIQNPELVQQKKEDFFKNLKKTLPLAFSQCPQFIYDYFDYVKSLTFDATPDYNYLQNLFHTAILDYGYKPDNKFDFNNLEGFGQIKKKIINYEHSPGNNPKTNRTPLHSNKIVEKPVLRKKADKKMRKKRLNWSTILIDPEDILRQCNRREENHKRERKITDCSDSSMNNTLTDHDIMDLNPTYAMIEVYNKRKDRNATNNNLPKHLKLPDSELMAHKNGYTHAMNLVLTKMLQRKYEEEKTVVEVPQVVPRKTRSLKSCMMKKVEVKKSRKLPLIKVKEPKRLQKSTRVLRRHGLRG